MSQGLLLDVPAHCGVDDDNQRFTTREALAWVTNIADVIRFDLDAAACPESHHAISWYGLQVDGSFLDGLARPWTERVFVNPPWDDIGPWVEKAWVEMSKGNAWTVAMLLPGNRTHRPWWQEFVEPFRDGGTSLTGVGNVRLKSYFAPKRFAYGGPGNPLGIGVAEPNFTSVALVWRRA